MIRWLCALSSALMLATQAAAECRQALALGLDVSGSVDGREYVLQRDGLAAALEAPEVVAALLSAGPPVALTVYEWSGPSYQRTLLPWRLLGRPEDIARSAETLRNIERGATPDRTALGAALRYGAAILRAGPDCPVRTLDISGDGKNISGPEPDSAVVRGALNGILVNGLAIGADDRGPQDTREVDVAELSAYFRSRVIHGEGSFVQVAIGYEDYRQAMTRKLLREVRVIVLGREGGPDAALPGRSPG